MTGHKSSDDEVSLSSKIWNSKLQGIVSRKNLHLFVKDKCLYRFMGAVIYLITSPMIKEFEKFGVNFHN